MSDQIPVDPPVPELPPLPTPVIEGPAEPLLVARNLKKTFRKPDGSGRLDVLAHVQISVAANDRIAIVGKSGSGKSTLLHVLGTLERPEEGSISFAGKALDGLSDRRLARFRNREIGFVFQFHYLMLEFTALENVMMPALVAGWSRAKARSEARALLERVGLGARVDHKPAQLSGGEQQRVAIARAVLLRPRLLLTDEMTGNLDPTTGRQILELLEEMHAQSPMALVSVTHDEQLAARYPRRYKLENGLLEPVDLP